MKICPVGAELFSVDGRTDMTKLTVAFRNSAHAPNDHSSAHPALCCNILQLSSVSWRFETGALQGAACTEQLRQGHYRVLHAQSN